MDERFLGMEEVASSNLAVGSMIGGVPEPQGRGHRCGHSTDKRVPGYSSNRFLQCEYGCQSGRLGLRGLLPSPTRGKKEHSFDTGSPSVPVTLQDNAREAPREGRIARNDDVARSIRVSGSDREYGCP